MKRFNWHIVPAVVAVVLGVLVVAGRLSWPWWYALAGPYVVWFALLYAYCQATDALRSHVGHALRKAIREERRRNAILNTNHIKARVKWEMWKERRERINQEYRGSGN